MNIKLERNFIMATLREFIDLLEEIRNLDPQNEDAQVQIVGKKIFITRKDQTEGYYLEIK